MKTRLTTVAGAAILTLCACAPTSVSDNETIEPSAGSGAVVADFIEPFKCGGTEPFWSLLLTFTHGQYMSMDGETRSYVISDVDLAPAALTFKGHDSADGTPVEIALTNTGQCSDGMSDFVYDYELTLAHGPKDVLRGCCGRQE